MSSAQIVIDAAVAPRSPPHGRRAGRGDLSLYLHELISQDRGWTWQVRYCAPERWLDSWQPTPEAVATAEAYSIGLACWEHLTGQAACPEGKEEARRWHLVHGPLDPRRVRQGIAQAEAVVVMALCARQPEARLHPHVALSRLVPATTSTLSRASLALTLSVLLLSLSCLVLTLHTQVGPATITTPSIDLRSELMSVAAAEPLPPPAPARSDGADLDRADALWSRCAWGRSVAAMAEYQGDDEDEASVRRASHLAAWSAQRVRMQRVTELKERGQCHAAREALAALRGVPDTKDCQVQLATCERAERTRLASKMTNLAADLKRSLAPDRWVEDVRADDLGDGWRWRVTMTLVSSREIRVQNVAKWSDDAGPPPHDRDAVFSLGGVLRALAEASETDRLRLSAVRLETEDRCTAELDPSHLARVAAFLRSRPGDADAVKQVEIHLAKMLNPC